MDDPETPRWRRRLSAEDRWQIFIEASAKDAKVVDVLRRWRIDSSQLARIRTQVKEGALTQLMNGPGRNPKDREEASEGRDVPPRGRLQGGLDRGHPAARNIQAGLDGCLRGSRLPAEVKLALIGAITDAKRGRFPDR